MDVASLVSAWDALVLQLAATFTAPTAQIWRQIVLGWVLHHRPAVTTGFIRILGDIADRTWTVYHKFFYRAQWSLDNLCAQLLIHVVEPMLIEAGQVDRRSGRPVVDLNIDDTTAARCGKHVAHAGWFKDASASGVATKGAVIHWAHNWIIGAVTLRLPAWPKMRWVLPVLLALYRKPGDGARQHPFHTRQQLAAQMVQNAVKTLPNVQWRVAADGQYATRDMVEGLPDSVTLVSRIRCDAAIYALPQSRPQGQRGRPARKGRRLPTPRALARRRQEGWTTYVFQKQGRTVKRQVWGMTCLWYHVCRAEPIRLVIVRDPSGVQKDDFFFCTDAATPDREIVQRYFDRWGVEESIWESKQLMGFENTRGWCSKTVNRQAPLAMVLTTLVKCWHARCAVKAPSLLPQVMPWHRHKTRPSFADMLSALRRVIWSHRISPNSCMSRQVQEIIKTVTYALSAAA